MARKPHKYSVGDKVAYSAAWLRSTGNIAGDLPFLRGTIVAIDSTPFGTVQLCIIHWTLNGKPYHMPSQYHDDGLGRVTSGNLTLVSRIGIDSALNT